MDNSEETNSTPEEVVEQDKQQVGQQPKPEIELYDPVEAIEQKFDFYIKIVIGVLVVAMITMILMTMTVLVNSFHFNSVTYREYSEKLEAVKDLREVNKTQQEVIKQNQEIMKKFLQQKEESPQQ